MIIVFDPAKISLNNEILNLDYFHAQSSSFYTESYRNLKEIQVIYNVAVYLKKKEFKRIKLKVFY